jgi:antitoxin HicB
MPPEAPARARQLDEYLARPYHITLLRNDGKGWRAEVDELAGCTAEAATPHEVASKIHTAMAAWISAALDEGREIPPPKSLGNHSGRLLLRLPSTLHGELARAADREGTSLNQFISGALAAAVGWRQMADRVAPGGPPDPEAAAAEAAHPVGAVEPDRVGGSRFVAVGLVANFVVVAAAAVAAVVLLIIAW